MNQATIQVSPGILSPDMARDITAAAAAKALQLGIRCVITVIDGGGNVMQVERMEGAVLALGDASLAKACAVLYYAVTDDLSTGQDYVPRHSTETQSVLPPAFIAGANLVTDDTRAVIGAIGVCGGSPGQDHDVALAGLLRPPHGQGRSTDTTEHPGGSL
jgi:uncharacterized protein GlcG (DUF336 family)